MLLNKRHQGLTAGETATFNPKGNAMSVLERIDDDHPLLELYGWAEAAAMDMNLEHPREFAEEIIRYAFEELLGEGPPK